MCLIGYAFAGKETQAALLKEKLLKEYGFELENIMMKDLVEEALNFSNSNPKPIVIEDDEEEE